LRKLRDLLKNIKTKLRKKHVFIIICLAAIVAFLIIGIDHKLMVTYYEIGTDKVDAPIRIAFLADLHNSFFGENQEILISMLERQNPDIIVMSGDMSDEYTSLDATVKMLGGLKGKSNCFYVIGNHEAWTGEVVQIKKLFREYGVTVLDGQNVVVDINGQLINICGVDDPEIGRAIFERQLESAFASIDEDLYTVFLFHKPELFTRMSEYSFDLMLSGHAHGGQWRIPHIINGLYSPGQGLFPKYTSGVYYSENNQMIVSKGLSLTLPPPIVPRIFNPPEIVIIDLIPN